VEKTFNSSFYLPLMAYSHQGSDRSAAEHPPVYLKAWRFDPRSLSLLP